MLTLTRAGLSEKQKAGVEAALDDISSNREADALRTVKVGLVPSVLLLIFEQ